MKRQLPFAYTDPAERRKTHADHHSLDCEMDTPERRALPLAADGIEAVLALGYSRYKTCRPHLPEHTHPGCIELNFCRRGSLVFEHDEQPYSLKPGNIFMTQPGQKHHLVTNSKGLFLYWMIFQYPKKNQRILGLTTKETRALCGRLLKIKKNLFAAAPGTREIFQRLFITYDNEKRGPWRTLQMRILVLELLAKVIESADLPPQTEQYSSLSGVIEEINSHPERTQSVGELAHKANLSPSRFTALFRQVTGLPPYAYISNVRLTEAKRLLKSTELSITNIASHLNFSSARHLATQFKAAFGTTMRDFREKNKRN